MTKFKLFTLAFLFLFAFMSFNANATTLRLVNNAETMWVWQIEKSQTIESNMENRFALARGESKEFHFDGPSEKDFSLIRIYYQPSWPNTTTVCDIRITPNDTLTPILVWNMNTSGDTKQCVRTSLEAIVIM